MTSTLFSGISLSSIVADAGTVLQGFGVIVGIYAALWAGRRFLGMAKGLFGR